LTLPIPFRQMAKLHAEQACLQSVEPAVVSFDVVVILFCLAVIADHAHVACHFFAIRRDRASFSASAEILSRIKTKSRGVAH
jgi:hypothetical protein